MEDALPKSCRKETFCLSRYPDFQPVGLAFLFAAQSSKSSECGIFKKVSPIGLPSAWIM
jgi:hypothetical protein